MGNKHLNRSLIPANSSKLSPESNKYINKNTNVLESWKAQGDSANIFVSIRYIDHTYQCFSEWSKEEMKGWWNFIEKIHNFTWSLLYTSASKGEGKTGFAYTLIPYSQYKNSSLSPDINMFELRLGDKPRVHGFRNNSIFYIIYLDRNHDITPS